MENFTISEENKSQQNSSKKKLYKDFCDVCKESTCKYRCPQCHIVYCGLICKKNHNCLEAAISNLHPSPKSDTSKPHENKEDIVDDEVRVPKRILEKLKQSEKIRKKLQSQRLRDLLLSIDNSDQRLKALNHEMKTNEHFMEFVQDMLEQMGYLDENKQFTLS